MCWRVDALQSGRKGGVRLVPKGMRMEVRCVPKYSESLRGKSGGVSGEDRSLKVKFLQRGGERKLGSRERRTLAGNCTTPGQLALVPENSAL